MVAYSREVFLDRVVDAGELAADDPAEQVPDRGSEDEEDDDDECFGEPELGWPSRLSLETAIPASAPATVKTKRDSWTITVARRVRLRRFARRRAVTSPRLSDRDGRCRMMSNRYEDVPDTSTAVVSAVAGPDARAAAQAGSTTSLDPHGTSVIVPRRSETAIDERVRGPRQLLGRAVPDAGLDRRQRPVGHEVHVRAQDPCRRRRRAITRAVHLAQLVQGLRA